MKARIRSSWLVLVLALVTVLAASIPMLAAEIIILHTNDVHSRVESHIPQGAEEEQGGRVRAATLVDEIRAIYGPEKVLCWMPVTPSTA